MLGSSVPGMGLVGSGLGVPPWNVDSLAMTHLAGEVQQIWAVLFGSNAVNEVLSGRRTVIRVPPEPFAATFARRLRQLICVTRNAVFAAYPLCATATYQSPSLLTVCKKGSVLHTNYFISVLIPVFVFRRERSRAPLRV